MGAADRLNFTPDQRAAIETREVSVALSAGAGCGKTFVLTQRFLSHLEPGPHPAQLSELVAITFTDKAAREMRDRIRAACRAKLDAAPPEDAAHWLEILYALDSARVATIHSFCTSLLRGHAVEAGIDPQFAVNDAAQTAALVARSARDTLHRRLEEEDENALALVLHFGLERSRDILAELIGQRFRVENLDELPQVSRTHSAAHWQHIWRETIQPRFFQEFAAAKICTETLAWLKDHPPKPNTVLSERSQTVLARLSELPGPVADPMAWFAELREAAKVAGCKAAMCDDPDEYAQLKTCWEDLRKEIDRSRTKIEYKPADVEFAAELTERTSRLAALAIADYETEKRQQGWLDFDDLLLKARELLVHSPDVARRLTDGIRLLMVDEFQDTDPVQADIVRAIAGPALQSGKLFLVGDVQQSIYRFRRARPQVFLDLCAEIPQKGRLPLATNFRSVPEILEFVNRLFEQPFGKSFLRLTASDAHQVPEAVRKSVAPVIEFLWATRDVKPPPNPPAKVSADDLRQREAEWIALRIGQLVTDGVPRIRAKTAKGDLALRPVTPGDIAILFRTLSDVAHYEAALTKAGIECYLVGGKSFYAQQEVFDLLNLGRWLDDPADDVSLVGCLRSPFFNLSDDGIHALKRSGSTFAQALRQPPPEGVSEFDRQRLRFAGAVLEELRALKDRLPPSELLRTAVERTGYDAALLHEFLGERKVANLDKLIRQAREFDDAELFTLSDYIRQLERSVQDQTDESLAATLEEAGDVVRLMTIHQSKGLEFPVVILADMNREGNNRAGGVVLHPTWGVLIKPPDEFGESREHLGMKIHRYEEEQADAEEIQRLFYVAATRAADRLILSAGMEPGLEVKSPWLRLLAERFDLQTGLPPRDPIFGSMSGASAGQPIPEILVHQHPPQVTLRKESSERLVPLAQLPEWLAQPDIKDYDYPETVRVFPPTQEWRGTISVSRLEELVSGEQPTWETVGDDPEDDRPRVAADQLGTIIHRVLQLLDVRRCDDWPNVLAECLRRESLTPKELAAVESQAEELLARLVESSFAEQLARAKTLHRELDFVLSWPLDTDQPRALITGQIDVLLQDERGDWHLVDYKTGQFPTSVPDAELLAPYEVQLGIYALAAERALRRPLASLGIMALRPQARLLPWDWSDTKRSDLLRRVNAALG